MGSQRAALAQLGRLAEARDAARQFLATLQHFVDGYLKAGLPE